jgi:hypothetical protein
MCITLAKEAKLKVEDVRNGVAIVMTPKAGKELSIVRDDARKLELAIHQAGSPQGETCGLFGLGRLPSVTTSLTEGMNTVRILMTTSNPGEVKELRHQAREQVDEMSKMHEK